MNQSMYIQSGALDIILKSSFAINDERVAEKRIPMQKLKEIIPFRVFKSLRLRIFLILAVVGIIPVMFLGALVKEPVSKEFVQSKMDRLMSQCIILRNHIISQNYMENPLSESVDAELAQLSAMYDGRVLLVNRNFTIIKDTYVMDEGKTSITSDVVRCMKGETISYYSEKDHYIEIALPLLDDKKTTMGVMFVTFSTRDVKAGMERIEARIMLAQSILVILVVIFSFFMAGRLLKPFRTIEKTIDKVSNGYLDERLLLSGYTETEKIADAFNSMLDKLKKIEDSRQEFVSNVSHELKTPITSIKVLADSLLMQEDVPNEMYREFFKDIANEVDRENEIITDLLTLVRLDKQTTSLNVSAVNINELVEMILRRLRPIAAKRNIEVVLESFRPIIADVDEIKISSAFTNLVENAIKYNVMDGWVRVTLNADHRFFYVKVADSGIGIPQQSLDQVFDRFYRVDKTRARETGGTGLGLAITKNIILLHDGVVKVYSKEGEGTTFTVRIPLKRVIDNREIDVKNDKEDKLEEQ